MFLYAVVDARVNAWFFGEQGRHVWSHYGKARHMQSIKPHPGDLELRRQRIQKRQNSGDTEIGRHGLQKERHGLQKERQNSVGETKLRRAESSKRGTELKRDGTQFQQQPLWGTTVSGTQEILPTPSVCIALLKR